MRTSGYSRLYVHLVWSTWERLPLITPERERPISECVASSCKALGAEALEVGGMPDHLHVLVWTPTALATADLAKRIKGSSAHLINHEHRPGDIFKWQKGYGAFSVSRWDVARVRKYIRRQKEHHAAGRLSAYLEPAE